MHILHLEDLFGDYFAFSQFCAKNEQVKIILILHFCCHCRMQAFSDWKELGYFLQNPIFFFFPHANSIT